MTGPSHSISKKLSDGSVSSVSQPQSFEKQNGMRGRPQRSGRSSKLDVKDGQGLEKLYLHLGHDGRC